MPNASPIFPMPEPHHYIDYGFDPQINYFQLLEEARRHSSKRNDPRPIDSIRFNLQKPISKDDRSKSKKRKWWKSAVEFWKRNKSSPSADHKEQSYGYPYRAVSGPVYLTESLSGFGSRTPCRISRPVYGPITAGGMGMDLMPYVCLRDLNVAEGHRIFASGPTPMPIYLVT